MKVVQLFNEYLNVTENWCWRILKNLPDSEIVVLAEDFKNMDSFPLPDARFLRPPRIHKYDPSEPWPVKKFFGAMRRTAGYFWRKKILKELAGAKVMHAHFSFVGHRHIRLSRQTGIPLVVSFYGYDYERLPRSEPRWYGNYKEMFRHCSAAIAEGDSGREKLIALGCPPEKTRVARLGVETDKIPFIKRTKEKDALSLVQVASFVEKKGQITAARSFATALKKCPNMTLTFVGKDPEGLRAEVMEEMRRHGISDEVSFIDGIDFLKLHEFLGGFHAFIHPSRYAGNGDCEGGAPIVLLDAQATGMPVIATAHCDIPSEVIHGKTGLLTPEEDVDALAGSIERLCMMGQDEYDSYCIAARTHVKENYDAHICAERFAGLYREIGI